MLRIAHLCIQGQNIRSLIQKNKITFQGYSGYLLYFTLIDQIVYEELKLSHMTSQFGLFDSTLNLIISPVKLSKTPISQNSDHCIFC